MQVSFLLSRLLYHRPKNVYSFHCWSLWYKLNWLSRTFVSCLNFCSNSLSYGSSKNIVETEDEQFCKQIIFESYLKHKDGSKKPQFAYLNIHKSTHPLRIGTSHVISSMGAFELRNNQLKVINFEAPGSKQIILTHQIRFPSLKHFKRIAGHYNKVVFGL